MKCDHYWPFTDEPVSYGEITVEMLSESDSPEWTVRNFRLSYVSVICGTPRREERHSIMSVSRSSPVRCTVSVPSTQMSGWFCFVLFYQEFDCSAGKQHVKRKCDHQIVKYSSYLQLVTCLVGHGCS